MRARDWFDDPARLDMSALHPERILTCGLTPEELRSGRPVLGIAKSGSEINPCNRIPLELARRMRDGIREAGGIAPVKRPLREGARSSKTHFVSAARPEHRLVTTSDGRHVPQHRDGRSRSPRSRRQGVAVCRRDGAR
ncbi:MAG: hypothetical protein D6754_01665 [Alphaproteobacteria bacterium]|nr:MAG: hypothetical protein D6754_01665 [Alphaproteobacteria bacterium]